MADVLLSLKDVRAGYGESLVLDGVSLEVPPAGTLAVLGRNGVGKSTLLLTIMGYTDLRHGAIEWRGRDIAWMPPHRRARAGLGWIPQEREIFSSLNVEENLTVASRPGPWDLKSVYALFPRLEQRRGNMGSQLSGGEQQMLSIARTLMINPSLLLLDEPLEGLAPIIVDELADAMREMAAEGTTAVLLVEQHAELALALTEQAVVIERGTIAYSGSSAALRNDQDRLDRFIGLNLAGGPVEN